MTNSERAHRLRTMADAMKPWRRPVLATVFVLALATSCTPSPQRLAPCDVTTVSCQEDVYRAVQYMRHGAWDPWQEIPPVNVISRAQYEADLRASFAARAPADPNAPAPHDHRETAQKLLGLISSETSAQESEIQVLVQGVAAFYSPRDQAITIIEGENRSPEQQAFETATLAHEFVHAAQDREVGIADFRQWQTLSTDAYTARSAIIEGEAELVETWMQWFFGQDNEPHNADWDARFSDRIQGFKNAVHDAPSPYAVARLYFLYPTGESWATENYLEGGMANVRALFENPPNTTVALMAPPGELGQGLPIDINCQSPPVAPGLRPVIRDTMGALGLVSFMSTFTGIDDAWWFSRFWHADRYEVHGNTETRQTAVFWRIRSNEADNIAHLAEDAQKRQTTDAQENAEDEAIPYKWGFRQEGPDVVFWAATSEELATHYADNAGCVPF